MKVISFYTEGGGSSYEAEAEILRGSLEAVGMDHHIEAIPAWGDWYDHTAHKADFIRRMRQTYPGPLLWIDSDACVHADFTAYFEGLGKKGYDFGVHYFRGPAGGYEKSKLQEKGWRLLSGTTWWGDTERARALLNSWAEMNRIFRECGQREGGGQKNLWYLTTCLKGLKVARLPGRYCFVFDKPWAYEHKFKKQAGILCSFCNKGKKHPIHTSTDEPKIIEHTIASRDHRAKRRQTQDRNTRVMELRQNGKEVPGEKPAHAHVSNLRRMVYETAKDGPMTVALDFDDTFSLDPDTWTLVVELLIGRGHQVFIVTSRGDHHIPTAEEVIQEWLGDTVKVVRAAGHTDGKMGAALDAGYEVDVWADDEPWQIKPTNAKSKERKGAQMRRTELAKKRKRQGI